LPPELISRCADYFFSYASYAFIFALFYCCISPRRHGHLPLLRHCFLQGLSRFSPPILRLSFAKAGAISLADSEGCHAFDAYAFSLMLMLLRCEAAAEAYARCCRCRFITPLADFSLFLVFLSPFAHFAVFSSAR